MKALLFLGLAIAAVLACKNKPAPESHDLASSPIAVGKKASGDAECRAAAGRERPAVRWAPVAGFNADLNYDGAADLVVWGTEGDSLFVLSIVECGEGKPGRIWSIPLAARKAFGTLDLQVELVNPAFGEGYLLENCMGAETTSECRGLASLNRRLQAAYERGGRGLQIGIPDRDNAHVYWDAESGQFVTWRL